ncbi:anti-sigma factor antagonist [Coprococcus catus]|uniref:Anti-sigma factor antagonist n=2 Tax=Coprococcus catus TaxID=116085 RepID=A0A3E2XK00_9FIRM|nr:anti-sigma factor antagonist [Coprococcus catus]MBD9001999.1 anti-sigma factor antagonist [Coprococcus catus]RGC45179.1 anti-sigma factor antagonist [Coprococcus catus]
MKDRHQPQMGRRFFMEYRIVHSILFVVPGREIDHFQAETIIRYTEGLLRQQCFRLLVFDLADTVFMDSAGVGMMIGLYREIRAWGGAVYIIRMQSGVRRIYRMAGLHKIIPCYEDEAQFLAAVEGGGAGDER